MSPRNDFGLARAQAVLALEQGRVFLELFHGRANLDDVLEDWGEPGPVFGPLDYVHTTYASELKFDAPGVEGAVLVVREEMVYYNGKWYGDWSVCGASAVLRGSDDLLARIEPFDPQKALAPPLARAVIGHCEDCGAAVYAGEGELRVLCASHRESVSHEG